MLSVVPTTRNSSTTHRSRRTTREKWTVTWFWSCAVACLTVVVVRSRRILNSLLTNLRPTVHLLFRPHSPSAFPSCSAPFYDKSKFLKLLMYAVKKRSPNKDLRSKLGIVPATSCSGGRTPTNCVNLCNFSCGCWWFYIFCSTVNSLQQTPFVNDHYLNFLKAPDHLLKQKFDIFVCFVTHKRPRGMITYDCKKTIAQMPEKYSF